MVYVNESDLLYIIVLSVAGLVTVLGNGILVYFLAVKANLKSISNYYMISLSIADTFVGMFVIMSIIFTLLDVPLPEGWCYISPYFELVPLSAGIFSFLLVAYDRYLAIAKALQYHPTKRSAYIYILIVWVSALVYSSRIFLQYEVTKLVSSEEGYNVPDNDNATSSEETEQNQNERDSSMFCNVLNEEDYSDLIFRVVDFLILFIIPITCLSYSFYCIIQKLWAVNVTNTSHIQRKRRVIKMLMINIGIFFLCWIPFYLSDIIGDSIEFAKSLQSNDSDSDEDDDDDDDSRGHVYHIRLFLIFLAVSHSYLNPIIYFAFHKGLRIEVEKVFCKCIPSLHRDSDIQAEVKTVSSSVNWRSVQNNPEATEQ